MRATRMLQKTGVLTVALTTLGLLAQAGTITGSVRFEGTPPEMKAIDMSGDDGCVCDTANPPRAEALVLGAEQGMANVFVEIVSGLPEKEYAAPQEPVVLTQKGCLYTPHVFGIQVGQSLDILNPDGILHNVHSFSKVNSPFNLAMPKFKTKISKSFEETEPMFAFKCDIHPWMGAYCVVVDHPFFAVTGKDGNFSITGLDAGTYEIEVTPERLGAQKATVTVTSDDTQSADFVFSRSKK